MQFLGKFGKIVCWRPPPGELAPPPRGNPGSTTDTVVLLIIYTAIFLLWRSSKEPHLKFGLSVGQCTHVFELNVDTPLANIYPARHSLFPQVLSVTLCPGGQLRFP